MPSTRNIKAEGYGREQVGVTVFKIFVTYSLVTLCRGVFKAKSCRRGECVAPQGRPFGVGAIQGLFENKAVVMLRVPVIIVNLRMEKFAADAQRVAVVEIMDISGLEMDCSAAGIDMLMDRCVAIIVIACVDFREIGSVVGDNIKFASFIVCRQGIEGLEAVIGTCPGDRGADEVFCFLGSVRLICLGTFDVGVSVALCGLKVDG